MLDEQIEDTWQKAISRFFEQKYEADFVKYLKELFKQANQLYEAENFYHNDDVSFVFSRKNKRQAEKKESDFLLEQFEFLSAFEIKPFNLDFEDLNSQIALEKQKLLDKYSPVAWLTWAAENARNVTFATHVSKLTHSAIDSPSFFNTKESVNNGYLTTSSLKNAAVDGAVRGNQYAPIYQFLELELHGKKLVAEFHHQDTDLLASFAENEQQKKIWNMGFGAALSEGKPSAHSLLKQVYFPIGDNQYHLLSNVVSSSMAQALFEFSRKNSDANFKLRGNQKYSAIPYFNFPNRASISITASNHGNASQLNGKRGGRLGLFSCQPPVWQSQLKPPIYKHSFFFELSSQHRVRETIQYLADFLVRFDSLSLSIKDPKRMCWIENWIEDLTEEAIVYVKSIQSLTAGWSDVKDIKLKREQQILLDCYREDEAFDALKNSNWQASIAQDFATWLNTRLRKANGQFTPQDEHSKLWAKLFEINFKDILNAKTSVLQEMMP